MVKKQLAKVSASAKLLMNRYDGRLRRVTELAMTSRTKMFSKNVTGPASKQIVPIAFFSGSVRTM